MRGSPRPQLRGWWRYIRRRVPRRRSRRRGPDRPYVGPGGRSGPSSRRGGARRGVQQRGRRNGLRGSAPGPPDHYRGCVAGVGRRGGGVVGVAESPRPIEGSSLETQSALVVRFQFGQHLVVAVPGGVDRVFEASAQGQVVDVVDPSPLLEQGPFFE